MTVRTRKLYVNKKEALLKRAETWPKYAIFAHGNAIKGTFRVPKNVAIVFLTQQGDCTLDQYIEIIGKQERTLTDLLWQRAEFEGAPLFSVAYTPGDTCPDLNLDFNYDGLPEGFWQLPLPYAFPQSGHKISKNIILDSALWSERMIAASNKTMKLSHFIENVLPDILERTKNLRDANAVVYMMACRQIYPNDDNAGEVWKTGSDLNMKHSLVPLVRAPDVDPRQNRQERGRMVPLSRRVLHQVPGKLIPEKRTFSVFDRENQNLGRAAYQQQIFLGKLDGLTTRQQHKRFKTNKDK